MVSTAAVPNPHLASTSLSAPVQRILSVDVLRGTTIAFMILVNDPGDGRVSYSPLEHAAWNGWTATDMVFPTFLFLVGCSIVFAIGSRLKRGDSKVKIVLQILRRTALLLLINYAIRLIPQLHYSRMRIFGVLPRIALCYLAAALLYLWLRRAKWIAVCVVVLLVGYWALMRLVPLSGVGVPGRDLALLDPFNNLAALIDRGFNNWTQQWLHTGALYEKTRDPEGLLSTLPAIGTSLLGVLAGLLLRSNYSSQRVRNTLLGAGAASIALGYLWNPWFPFNKNLWTSSYVLLAAGIASVLLGLSYWIFDVQALQARSKAVRCLAWPFLVFGSNAIAAYCMPSLYGKLLYYIHIDDAGKSVSPLRWLYVHVFAYGGSTANSSLAFALFYVVICFLPVWLLWRRKIFLRV